MKSVYERITDFLNEIKLKALNKNVLLVTHRDISRAIYWYFNGIPDNENCKVYKYTI